MSKFAEACKLSYLDWVAAQPNIDDLPDPEFSKKHIKQMEKLFDKMRGDKYHYFTRKTVKIMAVAAVLAALILTAFVIPSSREFIIENFDIFGVYEMTEHNNNSVNGEIEVGYIPEGYELVEEHYFDKIMLITYKSKGENKLNISKNSSSMKVEYNTEYGYIEKIEIGNIIYAFYTNDSGINCLVWNENDYIYKVEGTFSKEELVEIAQTVK